MPERASGPGTEAARPAARSPDRQGAMLGSAVLRQLSHPDDGPAETRSDPNHWEQSQLFHDPQERLSEDFLLSVISAQGNERTGNQTSIRQAGIVRAGHRGGGGSCRYGTYRECRGHARLWAQPGCSAGSAAVPCKLSSPPCTWTHCQPRTLCVVRAMKRLTVYLSDFCASITSSGTLHPSCHLPIHGSKFP